MNAISAKHLALVIGLAVVASAGVAVAAFDGRSIWGANNPGQGGDHAAMPDAAAEHNRAGADHPTPGGDDGTDVGSAGEGGENGTGEGGGASCQPSDVPPAHATDGTPSDGKPSDVPPAHAKDGASSGCNSQAPA